MIALLSGCAETREAASSLCFTLIQNKAHNFPLIGSPAAPSVFMLSESLPLLNKKKNKKTSLYEIGGDELLQQQHPRAVIDHGKMRVVVTGNWAAIEAYGINCLGRGRQTARAG